MVEQTPCRICDAQTFPFKNERPNGSVSDNILQILGNFENNDALPAALELLLLYYKKRPDLFEQFYFILTEHFGIRRDSYLRRYYTQTTTIRSLCDAVQTSPEDTNLLYLFVCTANQFLKLDISKTEGGRHHTVTFYTSSLQPYPPVLEYRKMLLTTLLHIYQRGSMQSEIEHILEWYGVCYYDPNTNLKVIRAELDNVLKFFSLFQPENLYHCVLADHIQNIARRIDYDISQILLPFLHSELYRIYSTLYCNSAKYRSLDYRQRKQAHRDEVNALVKNYTPLDIDRLLHVCTESIRLFDQDERNLTAGLQNVFSAVKDHHSLFLYLTEAYIQADTPYHVSADPILSGLFAVMPAQEVKSFITAHYFRQQNTWLWSFYTQMPENQISQEWLDDLLHYLEIPDNALYSSPYRWMDSLQKYKIIDPQFYLKALRIITDHCEENPFVFKLYVFDILNRSYDENTVRILDTSSGNISLLEDIYIKDILYSNQGGHGDHDGALLHELITADPGFLYRYLDALNARYQANEFSEPFEYARLFIIWDTERYMEFADSIFDYHCKNIEPSHWSYYSPLHNMLCNKEGHSDHIAKQDAWIAHTIEQSNADKMRMYELFFAIGDLSDARRKIAVEKFLMCNSDPSMFECLPIEPAYTVVWGSQIPYMQQRIDYLSSLLSSVSGLKYLKQRKRIEHDIQKWRANIRSEEDRELLESWYH